jgi:RNA polymerase sporulation-specific sigma factor
MFRELDDYEILDEIREGNQEALELMFAKYKPLISKIIHHFNLGYEFDDMMQEGYMVLLRSIQHYDMNETKTFTRYFELNLRRQFVSEVTKRMRRKELFHQHQRYIYENNHSVFNNSVFYELYLEELKKVLSEKQYFIYVMREIKNYSVEYIEKVYNLDQKSIYNSLHRARVKIRRHFDIRLDKGNEI